MNGANVDAAGGPITTLDDEEEEEDDEDDEEEEEATARCIDSVMSSMAILERTLLAAA
jgi:hypothetical protein